MKTPMNQTAFMSAPDSPHFTPKPLLAVAPWPIEDSKGRTQPLCPFTPHRGYFSECSGKVCAAFQHTGRDVGYCLRLGKP